MIEVTGIEAIQAKLSELKTLGQDSEPIMHEIGNKIKNRIEQNFEEQGYYGQKWAPIKVISYHLGYTIGKGKNTHTKKGKQTASFLNYVTGKNRILYESGDLSSKWTVQVSKDEVVVGTNVKYGVHHQFGTKKMVARPFMPIDKSGNIDPRMSKSIEEYLSDIIHAKIKS